MTYFCYLESPIGRLRLQSEGSALTALELDPDAGPVVRGTEDPGVGVLPAAARQLAEYFAGVRRVFELPLAMRGTAFQERVWRALLEIPYGHTCGYGELARRIQKPSAARAVGMANNRNPLPVFVPCHRVIGADGALIGYGGGLERKRWLLALEGAPASNRLS
ncbi:MAG: methylated-DNA--[protein]-cysteine S-methyltransferase [Steroidobacteraceae bacterium]|nr:methylated-DNA--[protein]-cysteine S-methyltransferase [Steroidobacteraceae bacterium]